MCIDISRTTANALRATTLERGGEMLAEINENLTHVAAMYREVSKTFMNRLAEGADNLGGANGILDETQRRNDAFDSKAAAEGAAAAAAAAAAARAAAAAEGEDTTKAAVPAPNGAPK